jgi:hypothetical protein
MKTLNLDQMKSVIGGGACAPAKHEPKKANCGDKS